jgi:hypothetical protein
MERMFEYRLRPNRAQEAALFKVLAASRRLYNDALAEWKAHFEVTGQYLHIYEQDKRYNKTNYPDVPAVVTDQVMKRLHRAPRPIAEAGQVDRGWVLIKGDSAMGRCDGQEGGVAGDGRWAVVCHSIIAAQEKGSSRDEYSMSLSLVASNRVERVGIGSIPKVQPASGGGCGSGNIYGRKRCMQDWRYADIAPTNACPVGLPVESEQET